MTRGSLAVFWCFLVILHFSVGALLLDASPTDISPGITSSLTVNCSFSYDGLPSITNIQSLTILKDATQLATVNEFTPDQANELSQTNASVSGLLSANGISFLSLEWTFPSSSASGTYSCEANVMDNSGQPSNIPATVQVTWSQPNLDQLTTALTDVQRKMVNQESRITELEQIEQRALDVFSWMFEKSSVYNGKYYMVYNQEVKHANVTEAHCEFWGGYLAEIDDSGEYNFIRDFLRGYDSLWRVLVGATDEAQEGQWLYRHSGRPLAYVDWGDGEPADFDPDYDCMVLFRPLDWQMQAHPCYVTFNFVCEVPAN